MTPVPSEQVPWWLDHVAVPVFFTFFGASLGFGFGRLKDWLDDHKVRKGFLKAVRIELSTICGHLEGTLKDATEAKEDLERGGHKVLYLATVFQTGIYASQLGKLKSVHHPMVIEVISFYDKLSNLEKIKSHLLPVSFDLTRLTETKEDLEREGPIVGLYRGGLDEVIKRIKELLPVIETLITKLPQ